MMRICTEMHLDTRAAAQKQMLWRNGATLNVYFIDGSEEEKEDVLSIASVWSEYANIKFVRSERPNSEIRISFVGDGAWSYVGNQALSIKGKGPTMVLAYYLSEPSLESRRGVVLHEFGHALGLVHEHSSPRAQIPWDVPAVMKYYKENFFWTEDMIRSNVLESIPTKLATEFDKHSIMLYPVPRELTKNGFEVPWQNNVLSATDKKFIAALYPLDKRYR